jgi:hypothetical protein
VFKVPVGGETQVGPYFQAALFDDDGGQQSPRNPAEARRNNFARKFATGNSGGAPAERAEEEIEVDFELELNAESFQMLNMIGDDELPGKSGGQLDSVLLKVAMPLAEDIYAMQIFFKGEKEKEKEKEKGGGGFKGSPLAVSVVQQIAANFCNVNSGKATCVDASSRINDGFVLISGAECHTAPPSHAGGGGGSGGFRSSRHLPLKFQLLPLHVLCAPRTYFEIQQVRYRAKRAREGGGGRWGAEGGGGDVGRRGRGRVCGAMCTSTTQVSEPPRQLPGLSRFR